MKVFMIKPFSLIIMSWFYISVGISHFTDPNWFLQIVPPYLPFKLELVYVSGFFEIIFGLMLILPSWRYYAGWGLDTITNCCLSCEYLFSPNKWCSYEHLSSSCLGQVAISIFIYWYCLLAY